MLNKTINAGEMIQQAVTAHQQGKFEEAEKIYQKILETDPTNSVIRNNLGVLLCNLDRFDEAEVSHRKAIELKPGYEDAHYNLGIVLEELNRFDEAEVSYRRAIELKPDFIKAHNNLGVVLQELNRFDEAEASYRRAIELKPGYIEAHNNLGVALHDLDKFDDAEASYRKAIELKPDYKKAILNLDILIKQKDLLVNIFEARKSIKIKKKNSIYFITGLTLNPFITHRNVEKNIFKDFYKSKFKELDKIEKKDARYGNGKYSDFNFFKNNSLIVKNIENDLTNIMKQAVKSDIYIMDSFLNIYMAGSGTTPHAHIRNFDKTQRLVNQKYSLTYYISVGDQNCSEPGNLLLHSPSEEIKLSDGMVVIIQADREHSAVYNGSKDRIMIGINFYSLI